MPLTLHAAFVPNCQQTLTALHNLVDKAETYAKENGIEASELIDAKLADDMWSLPWHVRACWVHSKLVLTLLPTGEFSPDFTDLPDSWDAMRATIADAQEALTAITPEQLEEVAESTVGFVLGGKRLMEMTGSNFLMSFSQPNVYFHATTFYDILRMKGLPLGKMDYMGPIRVLGS